MENYFIHVFTSQNMAIFKNIFKKIEFSEFSKKKFGPHFFKSSWSLKEQFLLKSQADETMKNYRKLPKFLLDF